MKEMIIYFSRADENYFGGNIQSIKKGNTEIVAEKLSKLTGGTLFKVEMKHPYDANYKKCVAAARKDQLENNRPEVKAIPSHFEDYDLVTIMYPNYCGTLPMAMFTVLEQLNFKNKKVRAVCTHEGSQMGSSEQDLEKLCKGAIFLENLPIYGSKASTCDALLKKWIEL